MMMLMTMMTMMMIFARLVSSISQRLIQLMHHSLMSVVLHDCTTGCWCWNEAMVINYATLIWWNHKYNKPILLPLTLIHVILIKSYPAKSRWKPLRWAQRLWALAAQLRRIHASLPILRPTIELSTRNLFRRICCTRVVGVAHLVIDPECNIKVGPVLDNEI